MIYMGHMGIHVTDNYFTWIVKFINEQTTHTIPATCSNIIDLIEITEIIGILIIIDKVIIVYKDIIIDVSEYSFYTTRTMKQRDELRFQPEFVINEAQFLAVIGKKGLVHYWYRLSI